MPPQYLENVILSSKNVVRVRFEGYKVVKITDFQLFFRFLHSFSEIENHECANYDSYVFPG